MLSIAGGDTYNNKPLPTASVPFDRCRCRLGLCRHLYCSVCPVGPSPYWLVRERYRGCSTHRRRSVSTAIFTRDLAKPSCPSIPIARACVTGGYAKSLHWVSQLVPLPWRDLSAVREETGPAGEAGSELQTLLWLLMCKVSELIHMGCAGRCGSHSRRADKIMSTNTGWREWNSRAKPGQGTERLSPGPPPFSPQSLLR